MTAPMSDEQRRALVAAEVDGYKRGYADGKAAGIAAQAAPDAPREPTCEEVAPGCIGFTNGCHCPACMGDAPREVAPESVKDAAPADALRDAELLQGLAKNDLVKNAPLAIFILTKSAATIESLAAENAACEGRYISAVKGRQDMRTALSSERDQRKRQEERAERAEAAVADCKRDAERYRWLRVNSTQPAEPWSTHSNPASLDAIVDAAIAAGKTTGGTE